ncbi:DUF6233 domain-containing protein [Streptomyces mirabilis]
MHVSGCYTAGKRRRPDPRDETRRLLTSNVRACRVSTPRPARDFGLDQHPGGRDAKRGPPTPAATWRPHRPGLGAA